MFNIPIPPEIGAIITWILFTLTHIIGLLIMKITRLNPRSIEFYATAHFIFTIIGVGSLILISSITQIGIQNAIYNPIIKVSLENISLLIIGAIIIILLCYFTNIIKEKRYTAKLLDVKYYMKGGAKWLKFYPITILYYLYEITSVNYMYILANMGWKWYLGILNSGMVFIIFGWALPHIITKRDLYSGITSTIFTIVTYTIYENIGKSPIIPIILWFIMLIA